MEQRPQCSAVQSWGVQQQAEAALGVQRCEVVLPRQQLREGAAAALEPGWAQGGCSSDQGLCLDTAATLLQPCTGAVSLHRVCGEPRCGSTHSTFPGQPFCAVTHCVLALKPTSEANPNPPSLRNLQKQDYFVRCGTYGAFH